MGTHFTRAGTAETAAFRLTSPTPPLPPPPAEAAAAAAAAVQTANTTNAANPEGSVVRQQHGQGLSPRQRLGSGHEFGAHPEASPLQGAGKRPGTTAGVGFDVELMRPGTTGESGNCLPRANRGADQRRFRHPPRSSSYNRDRENASYTSQARATARSRSRAQSRMQTKRGRLQGRGRGGRRGAKGSPKRQGFIDALGGGDSVTGHSNSKSIMFGGQSAIDDSSKRQKNKMPTILDAARQPGHSGVSRLQKGGWKRLFGVFSHAGERRTTFSVIPRPKRKSRQLRLGPEAGAA